MTGLYFKMSIVINFVSFQGGIYWFQIVDYYAAALSLMYIAFFECAAIVWVYGAKRLSSNVKDMTGKYPNIFFRICWLVISPLLILVSMSSFALKFLKLSADSSKKGYLQDHCCVVVLIDIRFVSITFKLIS